MGQFPECPESTQLTQLDPTYYKGLEHQGSWARKPHRCKPALSVRHLGPTNLTFSSCCLDWFLGLDWVETDGAPTPHWLHAPSQQGAPPQTQEAVPYPVLPVSAPGLSFPYLDSVVSVRHLRSLLPSPPSGDVTKRAPFSRAGGVFSVQEFPGGMGSKWPCGLREGFGGHWSSVCQVSHQAPFPVQEETLGWGLCFSKTLPSDLTRILPTVSFTLKVGMETCCLWAGERLQCVQYMRLPRWALSAWHETSVQCVHCVDKRQENIQRGCPVLGWGVSLKPKGDA